MAEGQAEGEEKLTPSEILKLVRASSGEPVEMKVSNGRVNRAVVKMEIKEMSEPEFVRFYAHIEERAKHGTLTIQKMGDVLLVEWTESKIIGERR